MRVRVTVKIEAFGGAGSVSSMVMRDLDNANPYPVYAECENRFWAEMQRNKERHPKDYQDILDGAPAPDWLLEGCIDADQG